MTESLGPLVIPVLLVHADPALSWALQSSFRKTEFTLAGVACRADVLEQELSRCRPRIVLADLTCGDLVITDVLNRAASVPASVVVFTGIQHGPMIVQARQAGATGFLATDCDCKDLLETLRRVIKEGECWPREALRRFNALRIAPQLKDNPEFPLTSRELEVLALIAEGRSNRAIGEALNIGFETAKELVQLVIRKLRVANRSEAAVLAKSQGVI